MDDLVTVNGGHYVRRGLARLFLSTREFAGAVGPTGSSRNTVIDRRLLIALASALLVSLLGPSFSYAPAPRAEAPRAFSQGIARQVGASVPIAFEPNVGQTAARVRFVAHVGSSTVFLTARGATVVPAEGEQVRVSFPGSNREATSTGRHKLPGIVNYFKATAERRWRTNIPTYASVVYKGVYPGIDIVYHGKGQRLEYDFVVHPGADPTDIAIAVMQRPLAIVSDSLVAEVGGSRFVQKPPHAYQTVAGKRVPVKSAYSLTGRHRAGISLGDYDPRRTLVIDPVLDYSTYLGGATRDDYAYAVAVDASGGTYIVGETSSTDFPTTSKAYRRKQNTNPDTKSYTDAFVTKLNVSGSVLIYSTYLGGWSIDAANAVAIDSKGAAFVAGYTHSGNFPTTGAAFQKDRAPGYNYTEAFVSKLNPSGTDLEYSTYLGGTGGSGNDRATAIAVDNAGAAYVAGRTESDNFPKANESSIDPVNSPGTYDAFVAKLNSSGSDVEYSTYLGSDGYDAAWGIAVGASHTPYVVGGTEDSTSFLTKAAVKPCNGGSDAFVAKLDETGLLFSTCLGGHQGGGSDAAYGVALDSSEAAYVVGGTRSLDFPTEAALFDKHASGSFDEGFVTKFAPDGQDIEYSTFLGGSGVDGANAVAVDSLGAAYVVGTTNSANFPGATQSPIRSFNQGTDAFLAKLAPGGQALVYSTYLGGELLDSARGVAVDAAGAAHVVGYTHSKNFHVKSARQPNYAGGIEAFAAKISLPLCDDPGAIRGGPGNDTLTGTPGNDVICGLGGNDTLVGLTGSDSLYGGTGNNTLLGMEGNDTLLGSSGNETLLGDAGADSLFGQGGNDTLDGGDGADTCNAGVGWNTVLDC